jgi:hypothetical protein
MMRRMALYSQSPLKHPIPHRQVKPPFVPLPHRLGVPHRIKRPKRIPHPLHPPDRVDLGYPTHSPHLPPPQTPTHLQLPKRPPPLYQIRINILVKTHRPDLRPCIVEVTPYFPFLSQASNKPALPHTGLTLQALIIRIRQPSPEPLPLSEIVAFTYPHSRGLVTSPHKTSRTSTSMPPTSP